jgi:hypothetical protein
VISGGDFMSQFLTVQNAITILVIAIVLTIVFYLVRKKEYDRLRQMAYVLILQAEHQYREYEKAGKIKFEFVFDNLYNKYIPQWLIFLFPPYVVRELIQNVFDTIKDKLDDGKVNGSVNADNVKN